MLTAEPGTLPEFELAPLGPDGSPLFSAVYRAEFTSATDNTTDLLLTIRVDDTSPDAASALADSRSAGDSCSKTWPRCYRIDGCINEYRTDDVAATCRTIDLVKSERRYEHGRSIAERVLCRGDQIGPGGEVDQPVDEFRMPMSGHGYGESTAAGPDESMP